MTGELHAEPVGVRDLSGSKVQFRARSKSSEILRENVGSQFLSLRHSRVIQHSPGPLLAAKRPRLLGALRYSCALWRLGLEPELVLSQLSFSEPVNFDSVVHRFDRLTKLSVTSVTPVRIADHSHHSDDVSSSACNKHRWQRKQLKGIEMKAVVFEGKDHISVKDIPAPEARAGELVVRIASSGICETDVYVYRSGAFARPGMVLGHMAGGTVVDVGAGVQGWRTGERVAIDPRIYCGHCLACRGGHSTLCETRLSQGLGIFVGVDAVRDKQTRELYHGALAEYCVVPEQCCYRVPDSITDDQLAAVEGVAFSVRCMRASGLRLGDDVVIFGAADYCLDWLQWAKQLGARRIAVVEPIAVRRQMAERFGADLVLDPLASDPVPALRKLLPFGADLVALYPNYPGSLTHAYAIARPRTTLQVLICFYQEHTCDAMPLVPVMKELTIRYPGLFEAEPWRGGRERGDYALAIELLGNQRLDVESYVTRMIERDEIEQAVELGFDRLPEHEVKVRVRFGR